MLLFPPNFERPALNGGAVARGHRVGLLPRKGRMAPRTCSSLRSALLCLIQFSTLAFVLVSTTGLAQQKPLRAVRQIQQFTGRARSAPGARSITARPMGDVGSSTGLVYEQDCNDPDNPLPTWACREVPKALLPPGYPYYVGHDEPLIEFFSNTPGSGNNMQWKIRLPNTDPTPTQNGTVVANRELYPAFWFSMALCDPNSTPFGPCTPNSDSNTSAAGSAILELQFYPPGSGCPDNSKWCAALTIDELTTNCGEPITAANITTDGTPGGTRLLMSAGDSILITVKDTAAGLRTDVNDLTSTTTGFMVASTANGFTQTNETTHAQLSVPPPAGTCSTSPFAYHPEYLTALPANQGSWINDNISFSFEIGHFELCGDAACATLPDQPEPPSPPTAQDDTGCGAVLGVGGCTGQDGDHDGLSYLADWPDGNASHPSTLIIGNALDNGVGPLSLSGGSYQAPYNQIFFQNAPVAGAFYPFYSQAGTGASCVFNFGNDIPGVTTNDFGKTLQYNTTIPNPCAGAPPSITKAFGAATIQLGQSTSLTFTITNPNATLGLTGVVFLDTLPAGLSQTGSIVGTGCGAFSFSGLPSAINITNATIVAGGTCIITATVVGLTPGVKNNATSSITANESSSAGTGASATITVVAPPMIHKAFAAPTVPLNQNTTLTFTITNPNGTVALSGVGFTDTLPSGLAAVGPVTSAGSCPATVLTFTASVLTASGITLPPLGTCMLTIVVKGTVAGVDNNTTSRVTSIEGGLGNTASASITVVAPPVTTKSFGLLAIPVGGSSSLSFTITNPNATVALTVSFTDTLPAGLVVSTPSGAVTTCLGGTLTANPGTNSISLSGAVIAATASCTITVDVTGVSAGVKNNTTGPVSSIEGGNGAPALASIFVGPAFQVRYTSNLTLGDGVINITNTGATGASLFGPGFGSSVGNICVNVYAFSPDEQLISCCSCLVTPNGLASLSVVNDLTSNTLTGVRPGSIAVKLLSTVAGTGGSGTDCTNSASTAVTTATLADGLAAWGTSVHPSPTGTAVTETPFTPSTLSFGEAASVAARCTNIIGNGSTFGICRACRSGGLGGVR